jgi:LmbE family N-acetylglucosaminyl deacetylase
MSAGIMAAAVANGQRVACLTATHGEAGETADESRWPAAELGAIRSQELDRSLAHLGVTEHYWLDYHDGGMQGVKMDAPVSQIATVIRRVRPDSILTFCTDGFTGHTDHQTIRTWAIAAAVLAESRAQVWQATEITEKYDLVGRNCHEIVDLYFNIDEPTTVPIDQADLYFELDDKLLQRKIDSLKIQASQTSRLFAHPEGEGFAQAYFRSECFMKAHSLPKSLR